jgi:formamidopyrimidine-DNA glycosylase
MQALAERLSGVLAGRTLQRADALGFSALKTVSPAPESLAGATLLDVTRTGKYLVLDFGARGRMLVHLSQAGRVDVEDPPKATRAKGSVVRLVFSGAGEQPDERRDEQREGHGDGPVAVLVREHGHERKAAWWVLAPGDDGPLERLGPEPGSDEFADLVLHGNDRRRVHTILRDQRTVSGVGRGYADDALWHARLSPYATLASLSDEQRRALLDAVRAVMATGVERERTRSGGLSQAKLGEHFEIHNRYGTPCPRCGDTLRRVSYESHEVAYCPTCQTGGKVLADRRLSRLVK